MSNIRIRTALGAIAMFSLVAAAPVSAQDAPAADAAPAAGAADERPEVSDSHLRAARAAIDAIGATDQFDNILLNAATQTKSEFIPNNPDLRTEISDMVDEKALELAPRRAALENEVARIYANGFSEEELTQIASFYTSEAGRKLLDEGPGLTRESLNAANVWSNGIVRDLRRASIEGMNTLMGADEAEATGEAEATPDATGQ